MRSKLALIATITVIPLALSACGSSSDDGSAGSSDSGTKTVGFLASAPRNDGGFTQYALVGVRAAIKANPDLKLSSIVDNATDSQTQIQGLEALAAKNDIVVADGAVLNKSVAVVAPKYPKVHFVLVAADLDAYAKNVSSVTAAVGLDAIVAGAVGSAHSTTKKLGMIAGLQVPASTAWYYGMAQGAAIDNPKTKVSQTYTGDYNDVGKAKQAAEAMMANGVDGILSDLDSGSEGVNQAAKSGTTAVYSVFAAQCDASPSIVGTGVVNWAAILQSAVADAATGKLPGGAVSYGPKSGALSFEFCPGKGSASEKALAAKVTKDIADGTIVPAKGVLLAKPSYAYEQR
jgi:basic membrane protein A